MTRILVTTDVSELGHGALAHPHRVAGREGAAPPSGVSSPLPARGFGTLARYAACSRETRSDEPRGR